MLAHLFFKIPSPVGRTFTLTVKHWLSSCMGGAQPFQKALLAPCTGRMSLLFSAGLIRSQPMAEPMATTSFSY